MTEGREGSGDEVPTQSDAPSPIEPAPPEAPTPEPAPSPQPVDWAAGARWAPIAPEPAVAAPVWAPLRIVSVFLRTLDTFVRHPILFILLAAPGALIGLLITGLAVDRTTPGPFLLGVVVSVIVSVVFSLAMILATDDIRAGRSADIGSVFQRALGRAVAGVLSTVVLFLAYFVVVLVLAIVAAGLTLAGPVGIAIAVGVFVATMVGGTVVILRLALAQAAIGIDGAGPIEGLRRSNVATRGNLWRLFGLYLLFGLMLLPLSIGVGALSLASPDDPLTLVLAGVSSLVATPLLAIALATAYGDLTGRPATEPSPGSTDIGRGILVAGLLLVGAVALVIGVPKVGPALNNLSFQQVPAADRGKIFAGTIRNPLDPCKPGGVGTEFAAADSIYIGGYFTKTIPAGQSGTVYVYVNGTLANSAPLTNPTRAISCYAELEPLNGAQPGTYRLVIALGAETIAEGQFTVR
jgi:hypothetical protein